MSEHVVLTLIKQADKAISAEDFDTLMDFYADDAVLVVQPGQMVTVSVFLRSFRRDRKAFQKHADRDPRGSACDRRCGDRLGHHGNTSAHR